ncbi:hypothetical protein PROAA_1000006 [Candidatus Propionivibrio aalborgensis]|uniref:Uncharacterized protein n=1 Tax=Candidatus Propionivibrio aalborgensis TaxID=1860101 RepID=A0A1A8XFX0_9RHOO|nr:hypothetical protein PROAA_1000006 [Candidatus Propionivibrio aalborgensis]
MQERYGREYLALVLASGTPAYN